MQETTAIITVTQGDWQYLNEWINYHHNLGVGLFLIAYNGPVEKYGDLPKYPFVKYYDYSTHEGDELFSYMNRGNGVGFSGWHGENTPEFEMRIMQQIENQLLRELIYFFPKVRYCCVIDTDEFISLKMGDTDITQFMCERDNGSFSYMPIRMAFYDDNNLIYNSTEDVLKRFTHYRWGNNPAPGFQKLIINVQNVFTKRGNIKLLSPHTCSMRGYPAIHFSEAELKHFFTKTLEEWIMKFDPSIDKDYVLRFGHGIFKVFFEQNDITDEKLLAIPELLKKYNVNYDPLTDEDQNFVENYKRVHKL